MFQQLKRPESQAGDRAMEEHEKVVDLAIIFSLKDEKGALRRALEAFEAMDINLSHIESRPSRTSPGVEYDFYVRCGCSEDEKADLVARLKRYSTGVRIVQEEPGRSEVAENDVPWFPKSVRDLHRCCTNLFKYGHELTADHPGFGDETYVERRKYIAKVAMEYS